MEKYSLNKTIVIFAALMLSALAWSQHNGFNYKAIIKDNLGNVVANQTIDVQFQILEDAILVYQETHTPTTGSNGLIILTIGTGTTADEFSDIVWSRKNHNLNVQVDIGSGFVDMGTTAFQSVPYANNVTGLERINEGNGMGWRLVGRNPDNYGNVGLNAVDLSISNSASSSVGATGQRSFASGLFNEASGNTSTVMGRSSVASGETSTAMGDNTVASGFESTAMGSRTEASGNSSTAMGNKTLASGGGSTAMGSSTTASNSESTAMGSSTTASGQRSTAMGFFSTASGDDAIAMGRTTEASGINAIALGLNTKASGVNSTAIGDETVASGLGSTAMGLATSASGSYSTAIGFGTNAPSFGEIAIGAVNTVYTPNSATQFNSNDRLFVVGNGQDEISRSDALTILKNGTITAPSFDISEITDAKALITKEYAEANLASSGLEAVDEGNGIGWRLIGRNEDNHGSIGLNAVDLSYRFSSSTTAGATGNNSVAMGNSTEASGTRSVAFGSRSVASSVNSIAMGSDCESSGDSSIAMGSGTKASGSRSVAMGDNTSATRSYSTAMGYFALALGQSSTAIGHWTSARSYAETAIGVFNTRYTPVSETQFESSDRLFVVGNGTGETSRSNALTVYKSGVVNINDAFSLPNFDGSSGEALITNGNGEVRWKAISIEPGTLIDVTTFGTNYGPLGGNVYENPRYYIESNRVYLEGVVQKSSGTPAQGDLLFTLPVGYRPLRQRIFTGTQDGNNTVRVDVRANGTVVVLTNSPLNFISLDGISFRID